MTGQTPPGGNFPATGRTLARKRWPWPKRDPSRERRTCFKVLLINDPPVPSRLTVTASARKGWPHHVGP
eukprot:scaffold20063_cov30-Phaeocystis_antarctica.AAC.2